MPDGERWAAVEPPSATALRMAEATHQLRVSSDQDYPARRARFDQVFKDWTQAGRPPWR